MPSAGLPSPDQLLGISNRYPFWYPQQYELLTQSLDWFYSPARFLGMSIPTGCHAKGQGILMYDGSIKRVEDIIVGDALMGMDSTLRRVLSLIRGNGLLCDIVPVKGKPFRVNLDHILTLKATKGISSSRTGKVRINNGSRGGIVDEEVRDVVVSEYVAASRTFRHIMKLFRVPVEFPVTSSVLPISPYVLGVILGDATFGHKESGSVTNCSSHHFPELYAEAEKFGVDLRDAGERANCETLRFARRRSDKPNRFADAIRSLGLWYKLSGDKFVPQVYKIASRKNRLELLAGLMDTDGYCERSGFDYVSKSEKLAEDVAFVCRSVGLAAYITPCVKGNQTGYFNLYFRVSISGDCSIIPTRHRKAKSRQQIKDVLVTGIDVRIHGTGEFYGFILDGDGRYLLDDFTVTHNSGKSLSSLLLSKLSEARTVVLTATKGLQSQYLSMAKDVGGMVVVGQNNFPCILVNALRADEGPCHDGLPCAVREQCPYRVQLKEALESKLVITNYAYWLAQTNFSSGLGDFGLLVADESHQCFSAMENYLTIFISKLDIQPLGIDFPESPDQWNVWRSWAEVSVPIAADAVNKIEQEIKGYRSKNQPVPSHVSRAYRTTNSVHARIKRLSSVGEQWVIQKTYHGYRFVPKWVSNYSQHLFHDIPKVVLMSAILSHRSADYLGVPSNGSRAWIEMDSHFPPSNTPIWHIPTARINYRTDDYGSTIWCSRIDQIIQRRLDRKGIVFTVSYERAKMLLSRSRFKDIMFTHSTGDVIQVVEKFKKASAPAVLVSPSVTTGYDFPMDISGHGVPQYIVIGKIPYPDTRDLVTKARHEDDKDWTSYMAMETLVQSAGRMTRSEKDLCEVLIIDDSWRWFGYRYSKFAPAWFRARVKGSLETVPNPPF